MDAYSAGRDNVALAAATAKTVVQIVTPATIRALVRELHISFDGVTAAAVPGLVELVAQTTAGTMSALTPVADDPAAPASLVTAQHTATVEPASGNVHRSWRLSPYGGLLIIPLYGPDGLGGLRLPISSRLGVRCTFGAIVNVNAHLAYWA